MVTGRRFGKTTLAIAELILYALSHKNSYLWYVAPTYRQAKMIAWRMLKKQIEDLGIQAKFNESELSVTLPTGSLIELKGADNKESLRGVGLNGLVVDEFASIYDNWTVWNEVLRPILTDKRGWVLFIGTPKGKDALWELWMRGQRGEKDWHSWRFKTIDNKALDLREEVEEARETTPERYFRQEYEASFEDFTGLIYPEFNEKEHIITPYEIPEWWETLGAIDVAVGGTTGVLWGVTNDEDELIIIDEYREVDKRVSEVVSAINYKGKTPKQWIIDPASQAKNTTRDGKLYSLFDEYGDNGIYARPGENDVDAGINRVAEYFKTNRIKIFSTCTNLIWELERYHYSESKETIHGDIKAKPFKKDDHLVDCLRYMVMARPQKSQKDGRKAPRGSVAWYEEQIESENSNWRKKYA